MKKLKIKKQEAAVNPSNANNLKVLKRNVLPNVMSYLESNFEGYAFKVDIKMEKNRLLGGWLLLIKDVDPEVMPSLHTELDMDIAEDIFGYRSFEKNGELRVKSNTLILPFILDYRIIIKNLK